MTIEKGTAKAVVDRFKNSQKFIVEYSNTGSGIEIFEKTAQGTRGNKAGEIDGLMFVNGKPIIIEAKSSSAKTIAKDIEPEKFYKTKIKTVEDLTGQTPEALLLIPKGESGQSTGVLKPILSDKIDELEKYLEKEGSHLADDEFPATNQQFLDAAQRIVVDFNKHGR